jgi:hypothetical protein
MIARAYAGQISRPQAAIRPKMILCGRTDRLDVNSSTTRLLAARECHAAKNQNRDSGVRRIVNNSRGTEDHKRFVWHLFFLPKRVFPAHAGFYSLSKLRMVDLCAKQLSGQEPLNACC